MGSLVKGQWRADTNPQEDRLSLSSPFRSWITPDLSVHSPFCAEVDRYHLYVSHACPWANRTMIMRALKGLQSIIPVSVVNWHVGDRGWTFTRGPGVVPDPLHDIDTLYQLYQIADASFSGRVTVPVLWDKKLQAIVNNESSDIVRMFNSSFDGLGANPQSYYPREWRAEIDDVNSRVQETVNLGVYKAGFTTNQTSYEKAVTELFETLDWLEERLKRRRYLVGTGISEADIRLFTTLVRFDAVYYGHFKCNCRPLKDYAALSGYLCDLYQTPGFGETVHFDHIKGHYYESQRAINPSGIVPLGPVLQLDRPHHRNDLS